MARRPLIGISCRMDPGKNRFYLRKQYSEAIFEAGGVPVLLPLIPDPNFSRELFKSLDAIVISGSNSDVDPHLYGEEPHPKLGSVMCRRDKTDLALLEEVFRKKKPLLAICFGIQILNVFLGGTLWQDIDSQVSNAMKHSQDSESDYRSHAISIRSHSLLDGLAGEKNTRVNSYHHQAIKKVAPRLMVSAKAPDGIVEAVELRDEKHFVLGVQWHPEIGWEINQLSRHIFSRFVAASKNSSTS
jgi:putative glutamine amidotransferase